MPPCSFDFGPGNGSKSREGAFVSVSASVLETGDTVRNIPVTVSLFTFALTGKGKPSPPVQVMSTGVASDVTCRVLPLLTVVLSHFLFTVLFLSQFSLCYLSRICRRSVCESLSSVFMESYVFLCVSPNHLLVKVLPGFQRCPFPPV